jgi:hypothetical protein
LVNKNKSPDYSVGSYDMKKLTLGGQAILKVMISFGKAGTFLLEGRTKEEITCTAMYGNPTMSLTHLEREFDNLVINGKLVTNHSGTPHDETMKQQSFKLVP